MANKVGIEFYVSGANAVQRDVHKISRTLNTVAKLGLGIGGTMMAVTAAKRLFGNLVSSAAEGSQRVTSEVGKLSNTWTRMKNTVVTEVTPQIVDSLEVINAVMSKMEGVVARLAKGYGSLSRGFSDVVESVAAKAGMVDAAAKARYRAMHPEDPNAFLSEGNYIPGYMGGQMSWSERKPQNPAAYEAIRQQLYAEQQQVQAERSVTAGPAPEPESKAQALTEVQRLTAALNEQVRTQYLASKGQENAAEIVRFTAAAQAQYTGDIERQNAAIEEYRKTLESLQKIQQRIADSETAKKNQAAIEQTLAALRDENAVQALVHQGRLAEADTMQTVQQFQRQGIELTQSQIQQMRELNEANREAQDAYEAQQEAAKQAAEQQREVEAMQAAMQERMRSQQADIHAYITSLHEEAQYLQLIRQGRQDEAEMLRTVNEFKAAGISLSAAEASQIQTLQAQNRRLYESTMVLQNTAQQFGYSWGDALESFAVDGRKASEVARNLAKDLQRLIFRQMVTQPLAKMISQGFINAFRGGIKTGAAGAGSNMLSAPSVATATVHGGGVPLYDRLDTRSVHPGVFAGAGFAHGGIGPGEMPAIIRKDEGVFTPGQMRAMGEGSSQVAAMLGRIEALLARQGERRMMILDRRQGVTRDEVAGIIIDDLDHAGPVATALGRG